jgi:hypothetical protein
MLPPNPASFKGWRLRTGYKKHVKGGMNSGTARAELHCSLRTNGKLGGRGGGVGAEGVRPRKHPTLAPPYARRCAVPCCL